MTANYLASNEYRDELQKIADKENAKPGKTAPPHCPKCKDRGSILKVVFCEDVQYYESFPKNVSASQDAEQE